MARRVEFDGSAFAEYSEWANRDKKLFKRLYNMIKESARTPFEGTGKPEPLKNDLSGCWSRRINEEHRLVYRVKDDTIYILSCYGHYK